MIESTKPTGITGTIFIQDNTDGTDKTVDLWIKSSSTIAIPQLPWSYSLDGVSTPLKSFNFQDLVLKQHIGSVYVGFAEEFTFHLGPTGTTQMGGPTDFTVSLNQHGVKTISIFADGGWKKAVPFVRTGGIWKPAAALVMKESTWKEST